MSAFALCAGASVVYDITRSHKQSRAEYTEADEQDRSDSGAARSGIDDRDVSVIERYGIVAFVGESNKFGGVVGVVAVCGRELKHKIGLRSKCALEIVRAFKPAFGVAYGLLIVEHRAAVLVDRQIIKFKRTVLQSSAGKEIRRIILDQIIDLFRGDRCFVLYLDYRKNGALQRLILLVILHYGDFRLLNGVLKGDVGGFGGEVAVCVELKRASVDL